MPRDSSTPPKRGSATNRDGPAEEPAGSGGYTVIARRFRPTRFGDVVGQEAVATTLCNSIKDQRIGHAFIFSGPRGVGKTSMARILARALNCAKGPTPEPCNECEFCREIAAGSAPDVVEIDAASHTGVDDVRVLRDDVMYKPLRARYKIFIVDESHMLSKAAFNAFLKTLEEPPGHVKFIFATTEPHKMPETIHSRCQRFDFGRIKPADIIARLKRICETDRLAADDAALAVIARAAKGSMRDAESLLEQAASFCRGRISAENVRGILGAIPLEDIAAIVDAIKREDTRDVLQKLGALGDRGCDFGVLVDHMIEYFRELLVRESCGRQTALSDLSGSEAAVVDAQVGFFSPDAIVSFVQLLSETKNRLKFSSSQRILVEVALTKLARYGSVFDLRNAVAFLESFAAGAQPAAAVFAAAPAGPRSTQPSFRPPERPSAPAASPVPAVPAVPAVQTPCTGSAREESDEPEASALPVTDSANVVRQAWPAILESVKRRRPSVAGFLREGVPTKLQGNEITCEFPQRFMFHKQQFDDQAKRVIVEEAAEEVLGAKYAISYLLADPPAQKQQEEALSPDRRSGGQPREQAPTVAGDPLVRKISEVFEARVVNVEE